MANAARIHAIESGKSLRRAHHRSHLAAAARCTPAGSRKRSAPSASSCPQGAGVGSAIGFLRAPVGYEVVRSQYARLSRFDAAAADALLADMEREAAAVVEPGRFGAPTQTAAHRVHALCRARPRDPGAAGRRHACKSGDRCAPRSTLPTPAYYDRPVPGSDVEVMSYAVSVATDMAAHTFAAPETLAPEPARVQHVRDPVSGTVAAWPLHDRAALQTGATIPGPAIIAEDDTSTLVGPAWSATIDAKGLIVLTRTPARHCEPLGEANQGHTD